MTRKLTLIILLNLLFACAAFAQGTEFTYQGKLTDSSVPPTANYDFQFRLFDALSGGTQAGATVTKLNVVVASGIFSVSLDFGTQFPGTSRFLDISVRPAGGGAYTPLAPRQPISSSPYAVRSLNAATANTANSATNATQLGGVAASQYVVTTDPRMSDSRAPTAGSANYIQNQNAGTQATSNFNVSGNGTANIFNAATQYNIGGSRVLSTPGTDNIFAGVNAGAANTGISNSFVGSSAGGSNTTGFNNSFFGASAGVSNTTGVRNSFVGASAGFSNTTGNNNAFVGTSAGLANTTGGDNSFFGASAGVSNTTGFSNSFVGTSAGVSNTTGSFNSFFGKSAGVSNTTGDSNSFFGTSAGFFNTTGGGNSFVGVSAGNANTTGNNNSFVGAGAGQNNTTGELNSFVGDRAGESNTTGIANSFFGSFAGLSNTTGNSNTIIGVNADVSSGALTHATAIGNGAIVIATNQVQVGRVNLDTVRIGTFNAGGPTQVCVNNFVLTFCSSSRRYKENVQTLSSGLNLIERLRPVTFDWKDRKEADLGLIAEEVAEVEPLLVIRNDKGVIESVKYNQISAVLINAVKEQQQIIENQQQQISEQQKQIETLQQQIDALKTLVCSQNPAAEVCKPKN